MLSRLKGFGKRKIIIIVSLVAVIGVGVLLLFIVNNNKNASVDDNTKINQEDRYQGAVKPNVESFPADVLNETDRKNAERSR
ncbi:hypothetical protein KI440_03810 [Candidatus Saccharibacteria bacterium TM7i]|nr:hypothetical protein KI440_03810 [Candidatus Saccharibacteria bacterium TM7i]